MRRLVKAFTLNLLDTSTNGWTLDDDGLLQAPWNVRFSDASTQDEVDWTFGVMVNDVYKANGIVFACILARLLPFSEVRFQYQRMTGGRPGDLYGLPSLSLLENPWPNGTTGELLARMEQDASLAGNFYATTVGTGDNRRIRRLRPDYVRIISGVRGQSVSRDHLDSEVLGYVYEAPEEDPVLLMPDEVVHYSPIPDPAHPWRGMSWLTPVIREINADSAATLHKLKFFENGGTPSYVIKYDESVSPATFAQYVELFNAQHKGVDNAYKILHIGGGADPVSLGANMQQLDFKATQGAGETRIAAAAGVGAIIAQLSEGMQGSSLNAGNYGAARRRFADMTIRPLWRVAAASLAKFAAVPSGSRLWYDPRDVAFLKEDEKDAADIAAVQANTINALVNTGWTTESAVAAVMAGGDWSLLVDSKLRSVQLQPAGIPAPGGAP